MRNRLVRFWRRFNDENLLFRFHGRATRREFLLLFFLAFSCLVLTIAVGDDSFSLLVAFLSFVIFLAAAARRLHDSGSTAWVLLALGVPYIGFGFVLWSVFAGPDEYENKYGPNPRAKAQYC